MANYSTRFLGSLVLTILVSSFCMMTVFAAKSTPYHLNFNHISTTIDTIDFTELSQQELVKNNLFLVEIDAHKLAQWGVTFEQFLVDYIPDNLFLLSTTAEYLQQLTNEHQDDIKHVMLYPQNVRFAQNANFWISSHHTDISASTLLKKVSTFDRSNIKQKRGPAGVEMPEDDRNVIDLGAVFAQMPPRSLNINLSKLTTGLQASLQASPVIDEYILSAPRFLQQFEDHYHQVEMDEASAQMNEDPIAVRQALDINSPSFDHLGDVFGDIVNAPTHGFLAVFTSDASVLTNVNCEHSFNTYYSSLAENVQNTIQNTFHTKSQWFINDLHTTFNQINQNPIQCPILLEQKRQKSSTFAVASDFYQHGVNMDAFMSSFANNAQKFASHIPSTFDAASTPTLSTTRSSSLSQLTSILPFNAGVSRTKHVANTLLKSNVGLNTMRLQLQSPLFMSNTTYIAETIHTRVNSFYDMIDQYTISVENGQIMFQMKQTSNLQQSSNKPFSFSQLKSLLMASYNEFIYSHENRQYHYSYGVDSQTFTTSDGFKQGYEQRALLSQFLDSLLFSFFESQTALTSQSIITRSTMVQLISTMVQHQINNLHEVVNHTLSSIALMPTLYSIEVDIKSSILNNYVRFALSLNLEVDTPGQITPPNMSWNGPYNYAGVTGLGVIVHIADTGADHKSCWLIDQANAVPFTTSYATETPSSHRKFKSYMKLADDHDYLNGHGSHVAGSVTGDCLDLTAGKNQHNGSANKAKLAFLDIAKRSAIVAANDFSIVFKHAQANGALITSNSWGAGTGGAGHIAAANFYSSSARGMDQYLNTNQDLAALFASSNSGGPGYATLSQQATAKNVIIIGSTQAGKAAAVRKSAATQNTSPYIEQPTAYDSIHNLYGGTSSTGPTFDGRIKPNFVAPGNMISSIASSESSTSPSCDTTLKTGTSMATPGSAGLWTLIQQMLQDGRVNSGIPLSSRAYSKSSIMGTLLHAIALSAAQPLHYRAGASAAAPQPMRIQTDNLPPIGIGGVTYTHFGMGEGMGIAALAQSVISRFYIRPSRADPAVTTLQRFIRIVPYINCKSFTYSISLYAGTDSTVDLTTPLATENFVYEAVDSGDLSFISATIDTNKQLYMLITHGSHSCKSAPTIALTIQEFTGATLATSQRFQDATCADTFETFPEVQGVSYLDYPMMYIRCPPALACTDKFSTAKLNGNRHYSTNSSICRAALHTGAMNMTMATIGNLTPAEETAEIANGQREVVLAHGGAFPVREERKSTWYGVTAEYLNTDGEDSAGDDLDIPLFGLQVAGDPITTPTGGTNDLLYLRKLPAQHNFVSGYGIPLLASVLPLTQYVKLPAGLKEDQISQRFMGILSLGLPQDNIPDGQNESYCFFISSKMLANTYQYDYVENGATKTSQTWTSGEDNIRVSLAWYDPPAALSTKNRALINDLDLFLYTPDGSEYRGNAQVDRVNNQERISLLPGTFTPGMYCAVVNAVNVPLGPQRYALVANGRGLEKCATNPLAIKSGAIRNTISGLWTRSQQTCTATISNNHNVDEFDLFEFDQFSHSHTGPNLGRNPSASDFHTNGGKVHIKQGGNCFSIHSVTKYSQQAVPLNKFKHQRLSDTTFENSKDWAQDNKKGTADTSSESLFALSGRVYSNSTFEGEYYKSLKNSFLTLNPNLQPQDLQLLDPSNSLMMEDNVEFSISGQVNAQFDSATIILKGASETCTYTYTRTEEFYDVQYLSH